MKGLYRCDQCSHEEWRALGEEPWLCAVCGWMRWELLATADDPGDDSDPSGSGEDRGAATG